MVTSGWDRSAIIWDSDTGEAKSRMSGHSESIRAVSLSPDGILLATASWDGTVGLWDLNWGKEKLVIHTPTPKVQTVAFNMTKIRVPAQLASAK